MSNKKLPLFVSLPRSSSTILFETGRAYAVRALGMRDLAENSEFFRRFSHKYVSRNKQTNHEAVMELLPVNDSREGMPMKMHYTYPWMFNTHQHSVIHKIRVLKEERRRGNEYYVKAMAKDFWQAPDELLEFYKDRKVVFLRSRNIYRMAWSLVFAKCTNIWHVRAHQMDKFLEMANSGEQVVINKGIVTDVWPDLLVANNMDNWENKCALRGIESVTVYHEDIKDFDGVCSVLDQVYDTDKWREFMPDGLDKTLPQKIEKDYKKWVMNYDEIDTMIRQKIKDDFFKD